MSHSVRRQATLKKYARATRNPTTKINIMQQMTIFIKSCIATLKAVSIDHLLYFYVAQTFTAILIFAVVSVGRVQTSFVMCRANSFFAQPVKG